MQFIDGKFEKEKLKDEFCISLQEVEFAKNTLYSMVNKLQEMFPRFTKQEPSRMTLAEPSLGQAPLSSANLQQQQQQFQKLQQPQRPNSQGSNTTANPSTTQSPFLSANSPHGTPAYADKKKIDMDLRIPVRKRQKQNNGSSVAVTGNSNLSGLSPRLSTSALADLKRQSAERTRPIIVCPEPDCDQSTSFENEEDLKRHMLKEHVRPHEHPVKYARDNISEALGLNASGEVKKQVISLEDKSKRPEEKIDHKIAPHEPGLTINEHDSSSMINSASQEPAINQSNINVVKTTITGVESNLNKDSPITTQSAIKEPLSQENSPEVIKADPWAISTVNPNDLVQTYQPFESGANGSISDLSAFRGITPNDTPESSKDGISEPNSDTSEGVGIDNNVDLFSLSWTPFGPSDSDFLVSDLMLNREKDEDFKSYGKEPPSMVYQSFDDMDSSIFDRKFTLDSVFFAYDGN